MTDPQRYEVRILIGPCSQEDAEAAVEAALDARAALQRLGGKPGANR
jgi:3-deoxy-D-arabino-heptulosonate 7-phosphate (DAHP) synthase